MGRIALVAFVALVGIAFIAVETDVGEVKTDAESKALDVTFAQCRGGNLRTARDLLLAETPAEKELVVDLTPLIRCDILRDTGERVPATGAVTRAYLKIVRAGYWPVFSDDGSGRIIGTAPLPGDTPPQGPTEDVVDPSVDLPSG